MIILLKPIKKIQSNQNNGDYVMIHAFLARLDEVQEELLYYPRRRRQRWRRRRR